MSATIGTLKSDIASFLGYDKNGVLLTPSSFILNGQDLLLLALNNARKTAERIRIFRYAEINAKLSIGTNGGPLNTAYLTSSVAVTGTLSPNVVGTWTAAGVYNGLQFYTITVSTVPYFLFYNGTAWQIRANGFTGSDGWIFTTTANDPSGTYTAQGAATGVATVAGATSVISIREIDSIQIPDTAGNLFSIEFMTNDEWNARIRRQIGRQVYDPTKTLAQMGVSVVNPIAYQQGQTIFLYPATQFTFPFVVTINVTRFMPDYTQDSDTDFFTQYAPDYLQWRAILEGNKLWQEFVVKQEGSVSEDAIKELAQTALSALLIWDNSIDDSTSTPNPPEQPPAQPAPQQG